MKRIAFDENISHTLAYCRLCRKMPMDFSAQAFEGPLQSTYFDSWLVEIQRWRDEQRLRMGFDGSGYGRPKLQWTQQNFIHTLLLVADGYFYDPATREYTVTRFLHDF